MHLNCYVYFARLQVVAPVRNGSMILPFQSFRQNISTDITLAPVKSIKIRIIQLNIYNNHSYQLEQIL